MTSRDERYHRNAQRLRAVVVDLAAEVLARGGRLDIYDLTDAERAEAEERRKTFWRSRSRDLARRSREMHGQA